MLAKNFFEPAQTKWVSPIVFVPEKHDTLCLCVDYGNLSTLTIQDSYPIQGMENIFDSLGDATIFSTLHAYSRYCQIRALEQDCNKTAFICHHGLFAFTRITFWGEERPRNFSVRDGFPTDAGKMSVCLGLFRRYREIIANATRRHRACLRSVEDAERCK